MKMRLLYSGNFFLGAAALFLPAVSRNEIQKIPITERFVKILPSLLINPPFCYIIRSENMFDIRKEPIYYGSESIFQETDC